MNLAICCPLVCFTVADTLSWMNLPSPLPSSQRPSRSRVLIFILNWCHLFSIFFFLSCCWFPVGILYVLCGFSVDIKHVIGLFPFLENDLSTFNQLYFKTACIFKTPLAYCAPVVTKLPRNVLTIAMKTSQGYDSCKYSNNNSCSCCK